MNAYLALTASPLVSGVDDTVTYALTIILGLAVGSFLNVVIYRVGIQQSIVFPNSRCPNCETAIKPYDNIPVLSWLLLRGKCRACKVPISVRYPLVEILTALLWGLVVWRTGVNAALPFNLVFATAMIPLIFIDADHQILPNVITYPGMVFALLARIVIPLALQQPYFDDLHGAMLSFAPGLPLWAISVVGGLLGALAGGGSLWLLGWIWQRLRGVAAMGLGDVKMMLMVGLYFGWRLTVLTIFLAALTGSLVGIGKAIKERSRNLQLTIPFGIFLGLGALTSLLFGHAIIDWYIEQFIPR